MIKVLEKLFAGKPTILIVDDDVTVAESLKPILKNEGYRVEVALDGDSAIAKAKEFKPALVLMDINMPGTPGDVITMRFSGDDELRKIPVIIITGYNSIQQKVFASQAGAVDYLVKPYDPAVLIDKIRKTIKK